jgi:decaprenylphosphoryl-5-phosphoribose phosphatase
VGPWSPSRLGILPDRRRRILPTVLRRLKRLDRHVLRAMRTRYHAPRAENAVRALGKAGEWGTVWVAIGLTVAAADARRRERWLSAAAAAPSAVGINYPVKLAVRRRRPRLRRLPPLAGAPSALSFPSAHATSSFAAATAMGRISPSARVPLYGLAGAICLTRPYLGMHYPSDVLGGAVLGLAIGELWPGVRPRDAEDRLIDLVANVARSAAGASAAGSSADGHPGEGVAEASGGDPLGEGRPEI